MRRVQPVPRSSDRAHTRAIKRANVRRPRLHTARRVYGRYLIAGEIGAMGWSIGKQMTRNGAVATFNRGGEGTQKLKRISRSQGKMKIVRWTGNFKWR